MKITINTTAGPKEVKGRKFSHVVGGESFNFAFHKSFDHNSYQVTHLDSGKRVCFVPAIKLCAFVRDDIGAAKSAIDELVARVGAPRARSVLAGA